MAASSLAESVLRRADLLSIGIVPGAAACYANHRPPPPMEVIVQKTPEDGCLLGARIMAKKVREKPDAVLGLATGRTPERLYRELVRLHREEGLDFSRVTTFNLDEYVGLPPDHPQSYRWFMDEHLFRHINVDRLRTHVPNGVADDLQAECRGYEASIAAAGGIDLQLLGLGRNGHIGFNEPTGSLRSRTWIKVLSEQTLMDNSAVFGDLATMPRHAITMGVGTILEARQIVLLAFGPAKVRPVVDMIEGPLAAVCPGSALQLHARATVVLDEAAAGGLRFSDHYRWIDRQKFSWQRYD